MTEVTPQWAVAVLVISYFGSLAARLTFWALVERKRPICGIIATPCDTLGPKLKVRQRRCK